MTSPGEGVPAAPDPEGLALLVAVAETGSLGRAAQRFGITQPAASLRVRALERRLGVVLLDRSPAGSTLTEAGAAVVGWARPVLDAMATLVRGVAALRDRHDDRVRVAASLTIADHLVPRWLHRLHAAVPGASVALHVTNSDGVAARVREGLAQLGFVEGPTAPGGLRSRVVGGDRLVVVVAPGHRWAARRRPLAAAELAAAPLVLREPGSGTREALEQALAAAGLTAATAAELGSTTAIKAAVAGGEGPAVLSELAVAGELADGRLVAVPVAGLELRRRFRAVWRSARPPDGAAGALLAVAAGASPARGR